MKAIVLNSGTGKRMGELTKDKPKCLVELNDEETILDRQLKSLIRYKITKILITTGPFEEKIKDHVKTNFPKLKVEYVYNPKYASTNYIYSLFLVKGIIDGDIILMHGDMVFEDSVFQRLLDSKEQNAVLVDNKSEPPEKDFKGRVQDGIIKEIGVNVFGENCFFLAPIYKLSKKSFILWLQEMEKFVARGEVNVYAENAFNNISSQLKLRPVYFGDELCMELDTKDDIEIARKHLNRLKIKNDNNL